MLTSPASGNFSVAVCRILFCFYLRLPLAGTLKGVPMQAATFFYFQARAPPFPVRFEPNIQIGRRKNK